MLYDLGTRLRTQTITAVEAAIGAGAKDPGCRDGPTGFRQYAEAELRARGVTLAWRHMPKRLHHAAASPLDVVASTARWIAKVTRKSSAEDDRFLVIGGDHSCAIGTWSGAADALRPAGALGLIWIDAHIDMHVPETSHSGAINGMPVAALLGYGAPQLTSVAQSGAALNPRHLCLIGARSFEPEEVAFAQRHGVRVIDMPEVRQRGLAAVLAEAHAIATNGTVGYGVSLDLDAFDPHEAPGVGTPASDGIHAADFMAPWSALINGPACLGIEIVEYNPARDRGARTARLMQQLVSAWAHRLEIDDAG
jgi:arginase